MFSFHSSACPFWTHGSQPIVCACPRPWRVRKGRDEPDSYPWRVERRDSADSYELFMRASTFDRAIRLADALSTLELRSFRVSRPSIHGNGEQ